MKKPKFIIFNDMHLDSNNGQAILVSIDHMLNYAVENNIKNIVLAGDALISRSAQRLNTFETLDKMIQMFDEAGVVLWIVPGNHDKTDYDSSYSFLEVYRYHPRVKFFKTLKKVVIEGVDVTLLPFFSDEVLIPLINEAEGGDVLISHFEMMGSENAGSISNKNTITERMLRKWKKVYLGHYHDTHEITKDIVHLPSLRQAKFKENANKGFSIIYDDFSYEIIKGKFREYTIVEIDLDSQDLDNIKDLIDAFQKLDASIRFEITGEESKLKAFDKNIFEDSGIQVKILFSKTKDEKTLIQPNIIKKYDKKQVGEKLKIFCNEKGYSYERGAVYFEDFMKDKDG